MPSLVLSIDTPPKIGLLTIYVELSTKTGNQVSLISFLSALTEEFMNDSNASKLISIFLLGSDTLMLGFDYKNIEVLILSGLYSI